MKEKLLVSACLLGVECKYSGGSNLNEDVIRLSERYDLVPVCPEQLGGLATPREPSEIHGGRVVTRSGKDVTEEYKKGAREALRIARLTCCRKAVLKERSPSCGCGFVYDGSFSGKLVPGDGAAAALLKVNGISVTGESGIGCLFEEE